MKKFLDYDNERTAKHTRTNKDSKNDDDTEHIIFSESDENLSSVSPKNQFFLDNNPLPISDKKSSNNDKNAIDEFFSDPSTQVSYDLVMTEYLQQTLLCILKSVIDEDVITLFKQYALLVIHIFISEFTNIEYTWEEVEIDSMALRKDGGHDILSLPKVATEHKGNGMGLSDDGRECFVMEISYALQNQNRQKIAKDLYKLL
ncbi:30442_t:CDS:2 [Gigaspora margarita]|uniref:30442_t:CDS:1 n=1 Tax=Gigaspora margarita TaxID=4874 RepID=A0ABN7V4Z0_GIGMA|nr:30442_t:CDS:2 [Gigaspora margarita]